MRENPIFSMQIVKLQKRWLAGQQYILSNFLYTIEIVL